jgi:membrane associated rhomboid family serine protease
MMAKLRWIIALIVLIWTIEIVNWTIDHRLSQNGIVPRTVQGLVGIPLGPFLHGSITHLALNTVPLLVLGGFVILRGMRVFLQTSAIIVLVGGALLWLFGRSAAHVGASVLIFGYFGYLVALGWYDRNIESFIVAVITILLYGGLVWGILPSAGHVSWEGHLFGLIAGIIAARLTTNRHSQLRR